MRFLVVATPKMPPPPDMLPAMIDGAEEWYDRHRDKLEAFGTFPGGGGFGLADVSDAGELHRMILEMPFSPFSDHLIEPVVDGATGFRQARDVFAARTAAV
jgi:hypothetical protein